MSCEFKNIHEMTITELNKHFREHWHENLKANSDGFDKKDILSQASAAIDLKQARLLITEIGVRDPESQ